MSHSAAKKLAMALIVDMAAKGAMAAMVTMAAMAAMGAMDSIAAIAVVMSSTDIRLQQLNDTSTGHILDENGEQCGRSSG